VPPEAAARARAVRVPASYAKSTPGPLYFVFHGYGGNHDAVSGLGFEKKFVSVFPDGIARDNAPSGWDESPTSTDITLFDQILAATSADYCIDPAKVYVAGFSWGGWMATALGCVRGNVVHDFASVEGGVLNSSKDCKGPVPGWVNHYKDDPSEPYSSGTHEVDFFTALNAASNPAAFDAPNPCVKYTGSAPFVFCNPRRRRASVAGLRHGRDRALLRKPLTL
jgi:poly(3-hydroxybutyrate) depolymerase